MGVYSSENRRSRLYAQSPIKLKFLQKRVGLFSRGYGMCTAMGCCAHLYNVKVNYHVDLCVGTYTRVHAHVCTCIHSQLGRTLV